MRPSTFSHLLGLRLRRARESGVQMVWITALAVTLSLWMALFTFVTHERGQVLDEVRERNTLLARVFADNVNRSIDSVSLANAALGDRLVRGMAPDGPEIRAALAQTLVNLPFVRGLGIVDAQGLLVSSTEEGGSGQVLDLSALGEPASAGQDRLGSLVPLRRLQDLAPQQKPLDTPAGVGFIPLIHGVELPNGARFQLIAMLNTDAFATVQQVTMADSRSVAALASLKGQLMASTDGVTRAIASSVSDLPPYTTLMPQKDFGDWAGPGLRAGDQLASFRALPKLPLVVIVEISVADAMADWWEKTQAMLAGGVVATLLVAAMGVTVVRSLRARMAARRAVDAAQWEVQRREHDLGVTIRSLQELIFRTDSNGAITFVNDHWTPVMGSDVSSALGQRPWELVLPFDRDRLWALFTNSREPGARRVQASLIDANGNVRTFDFSVMPVHTDGMISGFAGSGIDVTERVGAEKQLQAQLQFTQLMMEISPLPKSVVDLQGRYLIVNKAWEQFTGHRRGECAFIAEGDPGWGQGPPLHEPGDRQSLRSGQPFRFETTITHSDGSLRSVVANKVLLHGLDRRPSGVLCVFMDVSEFRDAERATLEARDAAEEASRAKSEFIANISHELRTPLQSIIGFSELGQIRARPNERLVAMFDDIHGAGRRMLTLVNDLLDVSRIDSTVGAIHLECCDLRGLIRDVVHEVDPLISARQLHVLTDLPPQPMLARVDPPRFQQVVRNLLANAIKFSPPRSRIDLLADVMPTGELRLTLRDQGPGIPANELEKIFEAFVQSSHTKDGSGGSGLGLAICRKIIDAHGGRIHAENLPVRGAAFHVTLPARSAPAVEDVTPFEAQLSSV